MRIQLIAALAVLVAAVPVGAQSGPKTPPKVTGVKVPPREFNFAKVPNNAAVNVRLTFYLIQADGYQNDDPEIRPIVVELRKVFKFTGYRLASTSILQAALDPHESGSSVKQMITDPEGQAYQIQAFIKNQPGSTGALLYVTLTPQPAGAPVMIDASVNLASGKTVVLGSATGGKDKAIILAVTPTIER